MILEHRSCAECLEYLDVRQPVLVPAIAEVSGPVPLAALAVLDRYMAGVHVRHLSGLPILPGDAA
jgi:hypothetical protein